MFKKIAIYRMWTSKMVSLKTDKYFLKKKKNRSQPKTIESVCIVFKLNRHWQKEGCRPLITIWYGYRFCKTTYFWMIFLQYGSKTST